MKPTKNFVALSALLLVAAVVLVEATIPFGLTVLAQDPARSVNENKTFNYELILCPGESKTQRLKYPADFVSKEITSDQTLQRGQSSIATARFRSDIGELTISAGANDGNSAQVMTFTVELTFSEFALGERRRQKDQGIFTTFTHTYKIKVTVLPKSDPDCPGPKRTPTGSKSTPPNKKGSGERGAYLEMCIGDTAVRTVGAEVKERKLAGFKLENSNPAVAGATFYVEKKGGKQTSAPIVVSIQALSEGQTKITISESPSPAEKDVLPYIYVFDVTVERCRVQTGPGARDKGPTIESPGEGYVPVPGRNVTVVPVPRGEKKEERRVEEKKKEKPTQYPETMKTIGLGQQTSVIGLVVAKDSKPGEQAVLSVVADPARYESIPGLKVVRKEILLPRDRTVADSLAGIVVDTGDGRTQRANQPIEISFPRDIRWTSITLRWEVDSTPLTVVDLPIETSGPESPEGLDPSESPALEPGEERVRRSREEAYRRAIRRAVEADQAVREAKEADLARRRSDAAKSREELEKAEESVGRERRRAIQKEEADAYKRAAEDASKKAQDERNKVGPERQKQKDEPLPIDRKEARERADEAERKATAFDEEAKRNQQKSEALEKEAEKTRIADDRSPKAISPTSYRMPPIARDVSVHVIKGRFNGDAIRDNVMVDGRRDSADVIAKSTSSLFYRLKEGTPAGMHRITLREETGQVDLPLCVLSLSLSADQLQLVRGQLTSFRAVITGPETLPASAWRQATVPSELVDIPSLRKLAPEFRAPGASDSGSILFVIENKSRDTVTIGQEVVVLRLNQQDFRNGPYRYEGRITARKSGNFKIDGTVVAFLTPVAGGMSEKVP